MEKGGNAGYQYFLLSSQCFQKASLSGLFKVGIVRKIVNKLNETFKPLADDKILPVSKLKAIENSSFSAV